MAKGSNVPATIPALGGEQSLNRYLAEIKKFPILAPEQEYMLAKRFQSMATRKRRRSSSLRTCVSWRRSRWVIAAMACPPPN